MKFEPGKLAVIIGEVPGCEENIGACVTLTEFVYEESLISSQGLERAWLFKDATRPLKMFDEFLNVFYSEASGENLYESYFYIFEKHLVPIEPDSLKEVVSEQKELVVE